ncbi:MAG: NAD-dependent epimerase/dehydratase family protein [Patescibacteria group bacterium]
MKCIVTGGAGFIGSHLTDKLIEKNYKVIVIDNLSAGRKENVNPKAKFHQLDICDFEKIKPLFKGVDYVFHLAAIPRVPVSVLDPVLTSKVNILGTVNVFKAGIDAKVKRIIFASSSSVYGDQKKLPLEENMTPNPLSPYAMQKLAGEQFAKLFVNLYKTPIICLRYFNVYGPRIDFNSDYSLVIGKFLKLNAQNQPLTIFGDGEQTRGFCYIDDVVEANIKTAESEKINGGEIINVGSSKSYSINYLSKAIGGEVKYLPERQGDIRYTEADVSLAKNLLGWEPKIDFKDGVDLVKEWFQKNLNKL